MDYSFISAPFGLAQHRVTWQHVFFPFIILSQQSIQQCYLYGWLKA